MMFILLCLFLVSHQEQIEKGQQCTCQQILSLQDCSLFTQCEWNNQTGLCDNRQQINIDSYCSINSTKCPKNGCALYKGICKPFSGCTVYQAKTHEECQKISNLCTTNGENCINVEYICDNFNNNQLACQIDLNGFPCYWDNKIKKCYQIYSCDQIPSTYKTHQSCQVVGNQYMQKCTAKKGGGCMDITENCSGLSEEGCYINRIGNSCFWDGSQCKEYLCGNAPIKNTTHQQCQQFLNTCTLNDSLKGCMEIASECGIYQNEQQCVMTNDTLCFWYSYSCKDNDTNCQSIQECRIWKCENALPTFNSDTLCRQFKSDCTVNETNNGCIQRLEKCSEYLTQNQCVSVLNNQQLCYWNGSNCVNKTCNNAILPKYNEISCSRYMSQCTAINNKCELRTCNLYKNENLCSKDYQNNQCYWSGHCIQRTCENASEELISHADCQQWLNICTVKSGLKGCQNLEDSCETYKIKDQCYLANKFQCLWINESCVQKDCSFASPFIDNDEECFNYLKTCMISEQKSGCVKRKENCKDLLQHQCTITREGEQCFWNGKQCLIRQCTQATYNSFHSCQQFLSTCTVNYDGTQYNGCVTKYNKCLQYKNQMMCIESLTEGKCFWNQYTIPFQCEARTCQNSNQTKSDEDCSNFLSTCTVNSNKTQCIQKQIKCNEYSSEINCKKTYSGSVCIWFNNTCVDLTCDKANKTYTTHNQCQQFSKNCTTNGKGCIQIDQCSTYTNRQGCIIDKNNQLCTIQPSCNVKQCSDAPESYKTDEQCSKFKKECTTNGNGCVLRTSCQDTYIQQACITDLKGNKCIWINNQCVNNDCSSAPITFTTELECQMYKSECTVNSQSQGCTKKGLCKDAKVQAACTTDMYGKQCVFSFNQCRDIDCSDVPYKSHYDCTEFDPSCSSNGVTCIPQSNCDTKIQSGCVYGLDGPCLWVKNSCNQYSSCTSLKFKTHEQCYEFSNECTTDGNTCIPIDKCDNLPEKGCIQGTDGTCVFLSNTQKCTLFISCNIIQYQTHEECQSLSKNCTTDETKCIELQEDCSAYTTISNCYFNKNKKRCYYDLKNKKCVDLQCSHLKLTTHNECKNELKTCITDNTQCIPIGKCEVYNKNYCNHAPSLDGTCTYDSNKQICRLIQCTELLVNCYQISNCIESDYGCVYYSTCDTYKTEKACKQGGTDGQCVWYLENKVGKCKMINNCTDASNIKDQCLKKSETCQWIQTENQSFCEQHTCSSKKFQTQQCQPILDFSNKYYEICAMVNGYCITQNLTSLIQTNCFQATNFTYTWDAASSACLKCGTSAKDNNQLNLTDQNINPKKAQILISILSLIISIYI